ncbi:MAG: FGGY-family carbohydrate kinase, partial [Aestuariivirgaceae bacterium]
HSPRGIAVIDAGATNTKIGVFSSNGLPLAERKIASRHVEGPPYRHIDPEPVIAFCRHALPELDRVAPLDVIVPCAHGAALACLAQDGSLALPVMDYTAEPPAEIVTKYRKSEPPFSEVFCTLLPMALTHAMQLHWQERAFPEAFARIGTIMTWIQYVGFRLCGRAVSEISSLSCQSQLIDVPNNRFSSLARARGWDRRFAPMTDAWQTIGRLPPELRGDGFRGEGRVLAGVHDSNANYLRYLAAGLKRFTLLSSGTWIIGFDNSTPLAALAKERDTASNTDVFGRPVASCRFYGGREFEILAKGAPAGAASMEAAARLIEQGTLALPSFTDSGGPIPDSGEKGRILGPLPASPEENSTLAALYCALMVSESLDAISSKHDVIIDGPFSRNDVFVRLLGAFRAPQRLFTSDLRDGTTAGAACLALMPDGKLPRIELELRAVAPAPIAGLSAYCLNWRRLLPG